jgi:hypothetical protein
MLISADVWERKRPILLPDPSEADDFPQEAFCLEFQIGVQSQKSASFNQAFRRKAIAHGVKIESVRDSIRKPFQNRELACNRKSK